MKAISTNTFDIPFVLLYFVDKDTKSIKLHRAIGIEEGLKVRDAFY